MEAVAVGPDGLPSFDRLGYRRGDDRVILFAFDLIELHSSSLQIIPQRCRVCREAVTVECVAAVVVGMATGRSST
jgi:hypothetical protein